MSAITLTMPTGLLGRAQGLAAQRGMSLSALVADLLTSAVADADIWTRETDAMASGMLRVGQITWSRDEVHQR